MTFWLATNAPEGTYSQIYLAEQEAIDLPLDSPATKVLDIMIDHYGQGASDAWDVTEQHAIWWRENHDDPVSIPLAYQPYVEI